MENIGIQDFMKYSPFQMPSINPAFFVGGATFLIIIVFLGFFLWRWMEKRKHNVLLPIYELAGGGYGSYIDHGRLYWDGDLVKFHIYGSNVYTLPFSSRYITIDKYTNIKVCPLLKVATTDFRPISYDVQPKGFEQVKALINGLKAKPRPEWLVMPLEINTEELLKVKVIGEGAKFAYVQRQNYFSSTYAKPQGLLEKYKEQISFIIIGGIFLLCLGLTLKSFEKIAGDVVNSFSSTSVASTRVADSLKAAAESMAGIAERLGVAASNATVTPPIG
jgi:hypothetical protein